jgi:hypothetical protein
MQWGYTGAAAFKLKKKSHQWNRSCKLLRYKYMWIIDSLLTLHSLWIILEELNIYIAVFRVLVSLSGKRNLLPWRQRQHIPPKHWYHLQNHQCHILEDHNLKLPGTCLEDEGKPRNTSVSKAGERAKTQTQHPLIKSLECYPTSPRSFPFNRIVQEY